MSVLQQILDRIDATSPKTLTLNAAVAGELAGATRPILDFLMWMRVAEMTLTVEAVTGTVAGGCLDVQGSAMVLGVPVGGLTLSVGEVDDQVLLQFRVAAMNLPMAQLAGTAPDLPADSQDDFLPADYRDLVGQFTQGGLADSFTVPNLILVYDSNGPWTGGNEIYFACPDLGVTFTTPAMPVALNRLGFELVRGLESGGGALTLHGTLNLGTGADAVGITASLEVPFADGMDMPWRFALRRPINLPNAFTSLTTLLGHWDHDPAVSDLSRITPSLPTALTGLRSLALTNLDIHFTPSQAAVSYVNFRVATTESWRIVDSLEIVNLGISGQLLNMRDMRLQFFGELTTGNGMAIGATLNVPVGNTAADWTFSSRAVLDTENGLGAALALPMFDGKTPPVTAADLPADFLSITGFDISLLELRFNPFMPRLTSFSFSGILMAEGGVRNIVTFKNPRLSLDVDDPFGQRRVGGSIGATVTLGTVPFEMEASRTPDEAGAGTWIFSAEQSGGPVAITELFSGAKEEVDLACTPPDYLSQVMMSGLYANATFGPETKSFEVGGGLSAPIAGIDVAATLKLACSFGSASPPSSFSIAGTLALAGQSFAATYDSTTFTANWAADADQRLKISAIASQFGMSADALSMIPPDVDFAFAAAAVTYDGAATANAFMARASLSAPKVDAVLGLVAAKPGGAQATTVAFAAGLAPKGFVIDLSGLPLVGESLSGVTIGVYKVSLLLAPQGGSADVLKRLEAVIPDLTGRPNLAGGLTLGVSIALAGGAPTLLAINVGGAEAGAAPAGAPAKQAAVPAPAVAGTGGKWISVEKSLGPISIHRFGLAWKDGRLHVLLDGEATLGPLSVRLIGVGVSSPLSEFSPQPQLSGLGVGFNSPSLTLSALLMTLDPEAFPPAFKAKGVTQALAGELLVKAGPVQLLGVGLYGRMGDTPWLFFYADAKVPIGGPPYFFITGLCGGFGFNSKLTLPTPSNLNRFPLLAELGRGVTGDSMLMELIDGQWVTPGRGDGWIAAGIHFTTFKVLDCMAMVVANVGNSMEFSLLGRASVSLPPDSPKVLARVNLLVQAAFKPNEGTLYLAAAVGSGSFLLNESCRLQGNMGFQTWFSGDHAGDFVLSVGGYHPAFPKPAHYPTLQQLGFNWRYSDSVSLTGGIYFAMTPGCAMLGGRFEVTYSSGRVSAWLTAYADAYLEWVPFYLTIDVGVRVGVELDAWLGTLSASVGATLHLAGPAFGGWVEVDVWFVSFTIGIGSPDPRPAVGWAQVASSLPAADPIKINPGGGLIGHQVVNGIEMWVVEPETFTFSTECAVPASMARIKGVAGAQSGQQFGVRAMNTAAVDATHEVTIESVAAPAAGTTADWGARAITRAVPGSLWAAPTADARDPAQAILPDRLVGLKVAAPVSSQASDTYTVNTAGAFAYEPAAVASGHPTSVPCLPLSAAEDPTIPPRIVPESLRQLADTLGARKDNRRAILAALQGAGVAPDGVSADLDGLAANPEAAFVTGPLLAA